MGDRNQETELQEVYRTSYGFVLGRARRLLHDQEEARDVAQEVFARAWSRWPDVRRMDSPLGWLLVATTNICLDRLRHRKVARARESALRPVGSGDPIASAETLDLLLRQEELTQQVVMHAWLEEMTQDEVARLLGVARKTVQRHLDRFRQLVEDSEPPAGGRAR